MIRSLIFMSAFFLLLFFSCKPEVSVNAKLNGDWVSTDLSEHLSFVKDGNGGLISKKIKLTTKDSLLNGSYTITKYSTITLAFPTHLQTGYRYITEVFDIVNISVDKLSLKDQHSGAVKTYLKE